MLAVNTVGVQHTAALGVLEVGAPFHSFNAGCACAYLVVIVPRLMRYVSCPKVVQFSVSLSF